MASITLSDYNDIKVVQNGETITLTRVNVIKNGSLTTVWEKGSWHTVWSGNNEWAVAGYDSETSGTQTLWGIIPSNAQKVRVTGYFYTWNEDVVSYTEFTEEEITSGGTVVAEIQDWTGSSTATCYIYYDGVKQTIAGYISGGSYHLFALTKVEAYY